MSRPNATGTKGVSIIAPEVAGRTHQVGFYHPVERRRVTRSIATADGAEARRLAALLSDLIHTPDHWSNLPPTLPDIIKRVWKNEGSQSVTPVQKVFHKLIDSGSHLEQIRRLLDGDKVAQDHAKAIRELLALNQKLQEERDNAISENGKLRIELANANGVIQKLGYQTTKVSSLPVGDAVTEFIGKQSGSKRYVDRLETDLNGFVEVVGKDVPVNNILPEQVISYVAKKDVSARRTEQLCDKISRFLISATGGLFRKQPVTEWRKKFCKDKPKPQKTAWLSEEQTMQLINALPEYWQSIAYLQWVACFRGEELSRIQTQHLQIDGNKGSIRLSKHGNWKPKNGDKGCLPIDLPAWSLERLKPLTKTPTEFLFTNNGEQWAEGEDLYKHCEKFCQAYCKELRKAAKQLNITIHGKPVTLLRSEGGKRILLRANAAGRNGAAEAAAILRDTEETVREHYADLVSPDVKQI